MSRRKIARGPLDYDSFVALKHESFVFSNRDTAETGEARLVEVNPLSMKAGLRQFELRFVTPGGRALPSGLYRVASGNGRPGFDLYVEASTNRDGHRLLNAHFTQLT